MKNTLAWLRRNCDIIEVIGNDYFYGLYLDHRIRLTPDRILQIGNKDFDRWANSVAYECVVDETKSIPIQINLAVIAARRDSRTPWERSFEVMKKMVEKKHEN